MESSLGICGDWFQETSHQYRLQKPGMLKSLIQNGAVYAYNLCVYYKASLEHL